MSDSGLSPEDVGAIQALFQAGSDRFGTGDMAGWASLYTEDGVIMPPNAPEVGGRANLIAFGESFPSLTHLSFGEVGVQGHGDLAAAWSSYHMRFVGDDGAEVSDTGKQVGILARQSDGSWAVTRAMFNSDLAPE